MRRGLLVLLLAPLFLLQEIHSQETPVITVVENGPDSGDPVRGTLAFSASGVMGPLSRKTADAFILLHPKVDAQVGFPSSVTVIERLLENNLVLGGTSRPLTEEEKTLFAKNNGAPVVELVVALDALRIVVHRENPLTQITLEQLNGIYAEIPQQGGFSGLATWGDLGLTDPWKNEPIISYGGAKGWGTTVTFEALIMDGGLSHKDIETEAIESIPDEIAKNKLGLGYTSLGPPQENVKELAIAESAQGPSVAPTLASIASGRYPLCRRFYFYLNASKDRPLNSLTRAYLDFILSDEGQKIIASTGAVPLAAKELEAQRKILKAVP